MEFYAKLRYNINFTIAGRNMDIGILYSNAEAFFFIPLSFLFIYFTFLW